MEDMGEELVHEVVGASNVGKSIVWILIIGSFYFWKCARLLSDLPCCKRRRRE